MKQAWASMANLIGAAIVLSFSKGAGRVQSIASADMVFTEVTRPLGITWQHVNGATPEKYLIETMGGGGAFLDFNNDGRLDIFLVQSGCHRFSLNCKPGKNALYRQNSDGTFTDVADAAGVANSGIYGMGIAVGDFDNDGYPHNVLYHNNRDGTFTDVTARARVAEAA